MSLGWNDSAGRPWCGDGKRSSSQWDEMGGVRVGVTKLRRAVLVARLLVELVGPTGRQTVPGWPVDPSPPAAYRSGPNERSDAGTAACPPGPIRTVQPPAPRMGRPTGSGLQPAVVTGRSARTDYLWRCVSRAYGTGRSPPTVIMVLQVGAGRASRLVRLSLIDWGRGGKDLCESWVRLVVTVVICWWGVAVSGPPDGEGARHRSGVRSPSEQDGLMPVRWVRWSSSRYDGEGRADSPGGLFLEPFRLIVSCRRLCQHGCLSRSGGVSVRPIGTDRLAFDQHDMIQPGQGFGSLRSDRVGT